MTPSASPNKIRLLPPAVAERIAAGEVIERPSSVVKELVENSVDAGATEILVSLEDGGKSLIEVLDNGHGMPPGDLVRCIERHATSKLSTLDDLEKILTLGFRGEALPSIGAVSDLNLLSRARGEETAYELALTSLHTPSDPLPKTYGQFLNSPQGTRIQARGLFSQIPARLKFLKSQAAEVSQVREWLERIALAHPATGFRLVSDGRQLLNLRPQDEVSRVRSVLSDGEDYPIVSATNDLGFKDRGAGDLHIRLHWLQGLSTPQARKLIQVVNGRALRDRMLQQALLAPFRQILMPGQFPALALFVEIDPAQLDVNVHPTKTEIRFLDSRRIFHAIQTVAQSLISERGAPAYASGSHSHSFADTAPSGGVSRPFGAPTPSFWDHSFPREPVASAPASAWSASEAAPTGSPVSDPASVETPPQPGPPSSQFSGLLFNTYILYDLGSEVVLIDQHAAHERVRYEALRESVFRGKRSAPQALLIPEAVRFPAESRSLVENRLPWLATVGFECELFGEDTLLFRAIPGDWGSKELKTRLKNLVEKVLTLEDASLPQGTSHPALDENLFEALASEACHSSVRAGDRLEREEAIALVEQLFRCQHPWNCPHGRPTVVRVPRSRFEEWFQRKI